MKVETSAVSVRGVAVKYDRVQALRGISVDFEWSQPIAILGPNGAGKTTLINVLTTMLANFSGEAYVAGLNVRSHAKAVRANIGLMPQDNNLYEPISGYDNLLLQGALHGMSSKDAKEAVADVLGRTDLHAVARRPVATYSGGMKRRLVYARTILHRPRLVFLDEPTTGLDVRSRYALWEDIERFAAEKRTVILTTHYIEEAERFCKRIVVVDKGSVIADGSPAELKATGAETLEEAILALTARRME